MLAQTSTTGGGGVTQSPLPFITIPLGTVAWTPGMFGHTSITGELTDTVMVVDWAKVRGADTAAAVNAAIMSKDRRLIFCFMLGLSYNR